MSLYPDGVPIPSCSAPTIRFNRIVKIAGETEKAERARLVREQQLEDDRANERRRNGFTGQVLPVRYDDE